MKYKISRLDLGSLDSASLQEYDKLTTEHSRPCLRSQHPDGLTETISIAIAVKEEEKPVALILASLIPIFHSAEIHSFNVLGSHLQIALGVELLTFLENELIKEKCKIAFFTYPEDNYYSLFLEKILRERNWKGPRYFKIYLRFISAAFHPPWLRNDYTYPPYFHAFPWSELTKEDIKHIHFLESQDLAPKTISPFSKQEKIDFSNSLGLRYKGKVVGWMITHRIAPDTIRYVSLFILKEFEKLGPSIKLLCDSIILQQKGDVPWADFELNLEQSPISWIKFVKRRLVPYANVVTYTRKCWKEF